MTKGQLAAIKEALAKTEALIAAANGEESTCAVFESHYTNPREMVALYARTWIAHPLEVAIANAEGDTSYATTATLRDYREGRD